MAWSRFWGRCLIHPVFPKLLVTFGGELCEIFWIINRWCSIFIVSPDIFEIFRSILKVLFHISFSVIWVVYVFLCFYRGFRSRVLIVERISCNNAVVLFLILVCDALFFCSVTGVGQRWLNRFSGWWLPVRFLQY